MKKEKDNSCELYLTQKTIRRTFRKTESSFQEMCSKGFKNAQIDFGRGWG